MCDVAGIDVVFTAMWILLFSEWFLWLLWMLLMLLLTNLMAEISSKLAF